MVQFSNCKINLGLYITSKREDGYHNLSTCFYPIPFYDVIEIIQATAFKFTTTGMPIYSTEVNNLCVKAYHLLKNDFPDLPAVHMHLQKNIPMGAGIGGGSANAAYTLLLLNKKFPLALKESQLIQYAAILGSDCAFFIKNTPCFASSRGEVLAPTTINLSAYSIVLIFPQIHINTKQAFSHIVPRLPKETIETTLGRPVEEWKEYLSNDFEEGAFKEHPTLAPIKETLYTLGAVYASMTGSGSTMYGIFKKDTALENKIVTNFTYPFKIV